MTHDNTIELIKQRLTESLSPSHIEVIDNSAQHHGHPGAASGGGHFQLIISSPEFANKSMLESHRMIYDALGELMKHEIHALSITIS